MYDVITCLAHEHNPWLVLLAAGLCIFANLATAIFVQRAWQTGGRGSYGWIAIAGLAGGFGIWSTHFIAMLAYDPGLNFLFDLMPTLLSLGIACTSTFVAAALVVVTGSRAGALAAGVIFGLGVACMHFTGMSAIEFGGSLQWSRDLVIVAILASTLTSPFAFLTMRQKTIRSMIVSAAILTLGIVGLHFTAMGAVTLIPELFSSPELGALSKPLMLSTIVIVSLTLTGSGLAAAMIAGHAARKSRTSEAHFQRLVRGVTDYAIYSLDPEGVVDNWNAGAERAKGYTAEEIVGENFARFYSREDQLRGVPAQALMTARETGRFEAEGRRYRKDGTWFWAHVVIQPVRDDAGEIVGFSKITRDITRQKADSDRIAAITANLDLALENMTQGICLFDKDERLILANARYSEIFRFPEGMIVPGMTAFETVSKGYELAFEDKEEARRLAAQHYARNKVAAETNQQYVMHRTSWGGSVRMAFNVIPAGGWVATFEDITDQVRSEEQIAFMARHDSLTSLPNRASFMAHLADQVAIAKGAFEHVAVIGIDLNKFKQINDQLGHGIGDRVLQAMASRVKATVKPHEMVARFGGDEFVASIRYRELSEVHDFLDRLAAVFGEPMTIENHLLSPGASMGVALFPHDGQTPEALIGNADLAMYRAKASLSEDVCFYDVTMDEAARDRTKMAEDLWQAADRKQFRLHYQVQKSVATGEITGYEVLLRWHHPERGNVSPAEFIPVAEECGAILPIGEWVLREACREAAHWPDAHKVAVNLSPVQIAHVDMPAIVEAVLKETGLAPARLELEITESSIIGDKQRALHALSAIKALGVSIAIDDFGTGYSSLDTLRSFPFDKIKLDRSFLAEVEESDEAKAMVRAILALGVGLRISVLAEGVETSDQLDILRQEGCQEAQGYLLGRPMPMADQPVSSQARAA